MYLLGIDIGSSSVKVSLLLIDSGTAAGSASYPKSEMAILSPKTGWAEQDPDMWWQCLKKAWAELKSATKVKKGQIKAIGISYQMHGLVCVDKAGQVLRPSIIWCDSRAVGIGEKAFKEIGEKKCLETLLNSPANFTASKLRWVRENEPKIYDKIHKIMLPGDYIAYKMTGEITTTVSGLSEGMFWDYQEKDISRKLLKYYDIDARLLPPIVDTFAVQCELNEIAASELGLEKGLEITYRAGDQPNNAFSLNVLNKGEIAATAGTSGVIYGVMDKPEYDKKSRVNTFVHVNHTKKNPRYGVLLCVNGTGIFNSWLRNSLLNKAYDYTALNTMAAKIKPGSEGLKVYPFGNGAERTLQNVELGASLQGINFNVHQPSHMARAVQESIAFGLQYGLSIMKNMGMEINTVRAGESNMFLSPVFREIFANVTGASIELYNTDGAQGAARGAGIGSGEYSNFKQAYKGLKKIKTILPKKDLAKIYRDLYSEWEYHLKKQL